MKPGKRSLLAAGGAAAFGAAFVWLLATQGPLAPTGVETARAERVDLNPVAFGIGTVEARNAYTVGPVQAGRLLRVVVDQGDRVKRGQLLAEIDPVDLDQRAEAAGAAAARARQAAQAALALVTEADSRARLAQASLRRYEALRRQNFVAMEMVDSRRHEAAAAQAALAAARSNAAAAQREVARAEAEQRAVGQVRASLRLMSPIDGVVTAREAEPGTTVVAGQAVLRLADPARLWLRARVDQARAAGVREGQPADVVLRSRSGAPLPGRVARVDLQSDAVTEERIVNVAFEPAPAQLYLGELAEVHIRLSGTRNALAVPRAALAQRGGRPGVWRVVDGRAHFTPVTTGVETDARVQVVAGLAAGARLIVYSTEQLDEGMRVRERRLAPR